ncbi:hypothetical protein [Streptosporangium sp. LJ11]|uniref:hypothetical protein n=1 Tax=Streptosporangium sp. LJ11 TaxID=3436927 RepID=UPI003F7AF75F
MLPKFEYADFHKFLVSVGALLIAAGLAIPIFLLQEKTVAGAPEKTIKELTPVGKEIFSSQQEQIRWLLHSWPTISTGLASVGLFLIAWGGIKWWQRQQHLELREEAELNKIRAETNKQNAETKKYDQEVAQLVGANLESPEEVSESIERKADEIVGEMPAAQDVAIVDGQLPATPPKNNLSTDLARRARESITRHYVDAEDAAAGLVAKLVGRDGEIFRNVRLRGSSRIDIVTVGPRLNIGVDVKIMLASSWRKNIRNRIVDAMSFALDMQNLSEAEFGRQLRPLIIWAIHTAPGSSLDGKLLHELTQRLTMEFEPHLRTFKEPPLFLVVEAGALQSLSNMSDDEVGIIENWARGPRSFILTIPSIGTYSSILPVAVPVENQ